MRAPSGAPSFFPEDGPRFRPRPSHVPTVTIARMPATDCLTCPACESDMEPLTLAAQLGGRLQLDVCWRCHAFWFDPYETIQLTPASTLGLFRMLSERASDPSSPIFPPRCECPRCRSPLVRARDMQKTTRFEYLRCPNGHGRFTTFVDFLKEKEFVKPLSRQQLDALKRNVQFIHCSNCGASIDLTRSSACSYCGSPLSLLDMKKLAATARRLDGGEEAETFPKKLEDRGRQFEALIAMHQQPRGELRAGDNLVARGFELLAEWLGKVR